jgi:hypothetical protein
MSRLFSRASFKWISGLFFMAALIHANAQTTKPITVYTSVDQEFAEVILKEAEAALGQPVRAIFDAEAAKTVGLERRLLAEKAAR